jgi:hypothetical protein
MRFNPHIVGEKPYRITLNQCSTKFPRHGSAGVGKHTWAMCGDHPQILIKFMGDGGTSRYLTYGASSPKLLKEY